jgi:UDP-N-acetylglucosamine diphosphorylase / glucose-1-phosphate thymidylyltransferase / UDP-N-acetylgalactosamine diphosphorylase / glucosamine-1-phosphate N-acetyltransferase / galactosamine-1-phosphate N-acetyltransferase
MKDIVAVVLAGGVGNRFWPFSIDKIVFPFMGQPMVEYSVRSVLPKEVTRVVVVTNSQNNQAVSEITFPVPSITIVQRNPHGMADAILSAASELQNCALIILNGDDVTDPEMLQQVVHTGQRAGVFGVIPGFRPQRYFPGGYLNLAGENVTGIVEKPGEGNEPSEYVGMLGHYISDSTEFLAQLRDTTSDNDDIYEKALSTLMKRHPFILHKHEGNFAGLKYPWHVLDVMDTLLGRVKSHRGKGVEIRPNVVIEGEVYIEDDVRIFENTKIIGPCYIGKGTIIGNNNMIRRSHIGANCVTGFNTDITRSYVGDDCWCHSNYIGDSVLEQNISMGGGAALANLRLDDGVIHSHIKDTRVSTGKNKVGALIGKNVRIGVNASIMPGVKIGKNSFIGSGVVLDKDLPEESYCIVKSSYTVLRNRQTVESQTREEFKKKI